MNPVSATVQLEKSREETVATREHTRRVLAFILSGIVLGLAVTWCISSGRDFILKSIHPYRVTEIDIAAGTMRLVHGNRTYVVRCNKHCAQFQALKTYPMKDVGAVVEYTEAGGEVIALPIVEEQTTFDVTGGHG